MMATLADVMTTPQPSRLTISDLGERRLGATGIIDSHTADQLLEHLRRAGTAADVQLDLDSVEFIDSSGLRTIVTSHQEFDEAGTRLLLQNPSESVTRLLEITGLLEHLHLGE